MASSQDNLIPTQEQEKLQPVMCEQTQRVKDNQHPPSHRHTHFLPQCGKGTGVLFLCPPDSGLEMNMQMRGPLLKGKTSASLRRGVG